MDNTRKIVLKRNGTPAFYNREKIETAILKAYMAENQNVEDFVLRVMLREIEHEIYKDTEKIGIEDIQDIVEKVLQKHNPTIAHAYMSYRHRRHSARNVEESLMSVFGEINEADSKNSDMKRENANINGDSAMGTMLKFGSEASKSFYVQMLIDKTIANHHKNGDIHIHDLDFYGLTTTCSQIDLIKLFKDGFNTGHGNLREPNYIGTYSALTAIAIQSNQNDQHGGQSIPNFDFALSIGVRKSFWKEFFSSLCKGLDWIGFEIIKDEKEIFEEDVKAKFKNAGGELLSIDYASTASFENSIVECISNYVNIEDSSVLKSLPIKALKNAMADIEKLTHKAMVSLIHNLNTMHSRAGAQVPFSSLNYGTDTSVEGRMITKHILLALSEGLGNGETPIFPIHIFKVKDGVNFNAGEPNYDLFKLACEVSAKRLFPNFSFLDAPFNIQYYQKGRPETEVAYMGCRTRVIGNVFDPANEIVTGRGNLSFTSINLPRLAILANRNISVFYSYLDEIIEQVENQLLERFKIQCAKKVKNYPFLMGQGVWIGSETLNPNDTLGEILKHGTLSVGFIGLAETLTALIGKHHGESKEAQCLGLEIVQYMRNKMDALSQKHMLNFTLLATPAEGLSGRFVKLDKKKFGVIEGVTDKEYYTNSFHVPVGFKINIKDKIDIEAPYHPLTNAGHITYVEVDGNIRNNVDAFMKIIRYMKEVGIGYGSINHPLDYDPLCGYQGVIGDECPCCGRKESLDGVPFERIRRITGYLVGTLNRFNNAKLAEVRDRKTSEGFIFDNLGC